MSKQLPDHPNIEHLRTEAKALLRDHSAGKRNACEVLRHLGRLRGQPDAAILQSSICLQEVQHALAKAYGFRTWRALNNEVAARRERWRNESARIMTMGGVRARMTRLRRVAIHIHPNWTDGVPFGWGLAQRAQRMPQDIERLIDLASDDASWRVRREWIGALAAYAHLGDRRVEIALARALDDDRHAVAHVAARALSVACPGCGKLPQLSEYVAI